ncbi:putative IQ motif, EF-hand binding protein [Rosa chinensis]|uniref:Putative IQ motif, EF-hand binding protein n=1 Tax=Rosa chinensis TaxID=74649 RepID=A0A2P6PZ04_ROSCH|nr:protein IQ-DOMAIN 32 [Rosa chinensis]PRQ27168.1 putative IQ motif, EF-hand binding protein [Rosa chinensis]
MGKSNSCFKIITCGNDSADKDGLEVSESKGSGDKRGWSFRKRSARHRVLSNTVITETPTSGNKESPESAPLTFQSPASTTVPEKVSVIQCTDEKPQLVTPENPKVSTTEDASEEQSKVEDKLDESAVVVVQTAVRGLLAQRSLLELKNVVKLQAAVRGHLVRRHAVGTLRCFQAIVKMQALVRARQSLQKDNHSSKTSKKANVTYISIEKLLSNSFARQLLESTPKNQPIHVKCDPSKPDSAWKWLEMWMSVSTKDTPHLNEAVSVVEQLETEKEEISESPRESKTQYCEMEESNSSIREIALSESEESLITYDADNLNFQASHSTSYTVRDNNEQPQLENTSTSAVKETPVEINLSDADSNMEFKALSGKPVTETEQPKRSMKRSATEQLETDGKKSVFGSRNVTNPAFIAAQSKFAELTSTTNSARSISSSPQDVSGVETQRDTFSSEVDTEVRAKELSVAENPVPHGSQVQVGGSECGTEISISSTLDSPDRSDFGAMERDHDHDAKVSEEKICSPKNTRDIDVETKDFPETPVSNLCNAVTEPEKIGAVNGETVNGETINSEVAMVSPQTESKPERTTSDVQREQDTEASMQAYGSSPEASPRSHLTVPESQQGTPSSLVSVKAKRNKGDKNGSNKKRMSQSAGKKSPSNPNHDSGSSKDNKNGKRRNSFGSTKPDQADQEPRDSSSSSSIPHFMQATESARAKLQATTSPRSSPDVQDREIYIKKRHSLPGVNGRQGSPRVQRSMSQAQTQQGAKGTERKWQR